MIKHFFTALLFLCFSAVSMESTEDSDNAVSSSSSTETTPSDYYYNDFDDFSENSTETMHLLESSEFFQDDISFIENGLSTLNFSPLNKVDDLFPSLTPYLSESINKKLLELFSNVTMLERIKKLNAYGMRACLLPDGNVHVLDGESVVQAENLSAIGAWLNFPDNATLTLSDIGARMSQFVDKNHVFFGDFKFQSSSKENLIVSPEQLKNWLYVHFHNMDNEISTCPGAREIWSRAWTLAYYCQDSEENWNGIRFLYDAIVESYATGGGCPQGRITRGLIAYARLLLSLGVDINF